MHATRTSFRHQQTRIKSHGANSHSHQFFNLLTGENLLGKVEELLPEHRERRYPPTETLSMFLAQAMNADRSCQHIVNQTAIQRLVSGLSVNSTLIAGHDSDCHWTWCLVSRAIWVA